MTMDMEILQDFLPEATELLQKAQGEALTLENNPDDANAIASLFRAFHTLKGGAGFLEATAMVDWCHHLEDLLDKVRNKSLRITPEMVDVILKGIDVIQGMLGALQAGDYPTIGPESLGKMIQEMASGQPLGGASVQSKTPDVAVTSAPVRHPSLNVSDALYIEHRSREDGSDGIYLQQQSVDSACPVGNGENIITEDEFEQYLDQLYGPGQKPGDWPATSLNLPVTEETAVAPLTVQDQMEPVPTTSKTAARQDSPPEVAETTLRVDAVRLDAVMNQVGELVLLRNRLASAVGGLSAENEDMARIAREMDLTVNDIQNTVMRLRMQPCKRLFQQLPRVVRDVSRQLGKEVKLEIVGEDVEIDKAVVDALAGPMTHLVRNSLDHGIEGPEERAAAGKARIANLRVAAIHLGDKVRIEVSDDGKGIDRQFVTQKAIDKGVITAEQAVRLSEQEALELIFRPGFSTKDQATDLSGRGVGMDVVKETARKLRGRLDLQTRLGQGTSIAMEFPLTLAVLPVLYLRLRQDIYALPVSAIDSLTDMEAHRIHRLAGRVTYRVDDTQIVPLVDLGALLQDKPMRMGSESVEGVLTERGLFIVSEVLGNEDSVVKPIDFLADQNWYQGATISGKGEVVLILDAGALGAAASLAAEGAVE
jgi:two-component system chemotaxis sensor kinase CheA